MMSFMASVADRMREQDCTVGPSPNRGRPDKVESGSQVVVPRGNSYDKYGSSNLVERRIMARFFAALDVALPTEGVGTVLEVGVGEGEVWARVRERYPDAHLLGVDLPDATL